MTNEDALVEHYGDKTVIKVPMSKNGLESFKKGLQETGFTLTPRGASRKLERHLFSSDWPIQISWRVEHDSCIISAAMCIPWGWTWIIFAYIMCLTALPLVFGEILRQDTGIPLFATAAFCGILSATILLIRHKKYKIRPGQKYDFSPRDPWHVVPRRTRQKWYKKLRELTEESFHVVIGDAYAG